MLVLMVVVVVVLVLVVLLVSVVDALLSPAGVVVVILLFHQEARCLLQHKPAKTWKQQSRIRDHKEKDGTSIILLEFGFVWTSYVWHRATTRT